MIKYIVDNDGYVIVCDIAPFGYELFTTDELPVGEGRLKRSDTGSLYYEALEIPIEPTIEEAPTTEMIQTQILLNTEYLVIMSELSNM